MEKFNKFTNNSFTSLHFTRYFQSVTIEVKLNNNSFQNKTKHQAKILNKFLPILQPFAMTSPYVGL